MLPDCLFLLIQERWLDLTVTMKAIEANLDKIAQEQGAGESILNI